MDRNKKARQLKKYEVMEAKRRIEHNKELLKKDEEELTNLDKNFEKYVKEQKAILSLQKEELETSKRMMEIEVEHLKPINPVFEYETIPEYQELIRKRASISTTNINKQLENIKKQESMLDNEMREQVKKKKEDLQAQIRRLKLEIEDLTSKIGKKYDYIG